MRRAFVHTPRNSAVRAGAIGLALLGCSCSPQPMTAAAVDPGPAAPIVEYVTHQEVLTPLPLRVRLPARYGAEHVLVFVLTWGSRDWAVLELGRNGQTWSGEVSCRDVSTVTGDTRYFFLALDPQGETVVDSGSPEWPYVATIVRSLSDGPRRLPGDFPPVRCHDPADCPPDFPGCPAYAVLRPACTTSDDCENGMPCEWDGYCSATPKADFYVDADIDEDDDFSDDDRLAAAVRKATRRYRTAAASRPIRW